MPGRQRRSEDVISTVPASVAGLRPGTARNFYPRSWSQRRRALDGSWRLKMHLNWEHAMKKAILSLPLVIPLVTIMPAPAAAHFCCCAALAPTVPKSNPPPPAGAKVGDDCAPVARAWTDAICASTNFGVPCTLSTVNQPQLLLHYVVAIDTITGLLFCTPSGVFKTNGFSQPVDVCTANFCAHGECAGR
jgi:hypothetical protein